MNERAEIIEALDEEIALLGMMIGAMKQRASDAADEVAMERLPDLLRQRREAMSRRAELRGKRATEPGETPKLQVARPPRFKGGYVYTKGGKGGSAGRRYSPVRLDDPDTGSAVKFLPTITPTEGGYIDMTLLKKRTAKLLADIDRLVGE